MEHSENQLKSNILYEKWPFLFRIPNLLSCQKTAETLPMDIFRGSFFQTIFRISKIIIRMKVKLEIREAFVNRRDGS